MRPFLIAMGLSITFAIPLPAYYEPYHFFELVGGAELIVAGEIVSLSEQTYVLRIDRVLAGDHADATVEIVRFIDWPCARRYGPYTVGEKLVAFLIKSEHRTREAGRLIYETMGADTASECPIRDGFAYCLIGISVPEAMQGKLGRHDSRPRFPVDDVYSAITGYRSLYRVQLGEMRQYELNSQKGFFFANRIERSNGQNPTKGPFRSRRSEPDFVTRLHVFAGQSLLHRHLVDRTEQAAAYLGIPSIGWKLQSVDRSPTPTVIHYRSATETEAQRPK